MVQGVSVIASVSFVASVPFVASVSSVGIDSCVWLLKRWDSGTECRVFNGALVARFRV